MPQQEPAASKGNLEWPVSFGLFLFGAAAPAISMHFLRGNSIPIGSCQCRVRWQSNAPVIDPGAFSGAARKLATAAALPYDSNQRFST